MNRGTYSLLGFALFWKSSSNQVECHHINMLLSNTNQDAATTIKCLERLTELPEWKKNKRLYFWADSGRHFLNAPLLSFVYDLPGFCSFSFFAGRHGKNDCDSHFGVVRRKLEDASRQRKIETLPEVAQVLDTINTTQQTVC